MYECMCYVHLVADTYMYVAPGLMAEKQWRTGVISLLYFVTLQQVGMCIAAITASQQRVLFIC